MERRDYLMAQIEEMGKALAKLVAGFLGWKRNGDPARGLEITNEQFKAEVDLDIDFIFAADKPELEKYFSEKRLVDSHVELLSDYFKEVAGGLAETDQPEAKKWYQKALVLLEIADEVSNTASFTRIAKKEELHSLIRK